MTQNLLTQAPGRDAAPQDQQVGVAYLLADEGIGQIARGADAVPVGLVEMVSRADLFVLLAQPDRLVGVALHGHPPEIDHIRAGVHLSADLVDQRRLVERRRFLRKRQRQAIVAETQNIHNGFFSPKI